MSSSGLRRRLIDQADALRREHRAPGMAIAIRRSGEEWLRAGLGHADLEGTEPLSADARFSAYSITKTFTAVVALRLAEEGRIDLDATLESWHPELRWARRVSLRQLLNHRAGVPNYSVLPAQIEALAASPSAAWSFDDFVREVCGGPLDFEPGTTFAYSNTGYMLLRNVIERVADAPLGDLARRFVCEPLGLRETFAWTDLEAARLLTPGFTWEWSGGERGEDVRSRYDPGWCATGVLGSTAPELGVFFEALFDGRLLSQACLAEMLEILPVPGVEMDGTPSYGLGLMALPDGRFGPEYGHGGGGPGYDVHAAHFPALAGESFTLAVLCNRDGACAWPTLLALVRSIAEA